MASQGSSRDDLPHFYVHAIPESRRDVLMSELRATATAAVGDFPSHLNALTAILRRVDCTSALADFSNIWFLARMDGQTNEIGLDVMQHHAELLQAVALTMEPAHWGGIAPAMCELEAIFAWIKVLAEAPTMNYMATARHEGTGAWAEDHLLLRMRQRTQAVRNWDYYPRSIATAKALYGPLDGSLAKGLKRALGFDIVDLTVLTETIASLFMTRQNRHVPTCATAVDAHTPLERYRELLPDIYTFDVATLASSSRLSAATVNAIMSSLSLKPGALVGHRPQHLYLDNPIWLRPFIDLGTGQFLIPIIQATFSHLHLIAKRLSDEAGVIRQLDKRRSDYLEAEVADVLQGLGAGGTPRSSVAATAAEVSKNAKWAWKGATYETDCLALLDRTLLIVEAKSSRLTREVLRAAPGSFKDLIRKVVLKPSEQSARLLALIEDARKGDAEAVAVCRGLHPDACDIDLVIRLSITLDDLSFICTAEPTLKEAQWIPPEHDLPTTMTIYDFRHVLHILDNPILLFHYLHERSFLQKIQNVLADELDLLVLYLQTGLNIGSVPDGDLLLRASGSELIDRYYMACESGTPVAKPKPRLRPIFRRIVEKLTATRPPGWVTMGRHVLSCADYEQQETVERRLRKLRKTVQRRRREREPQYALEIHPEEDRKAVVLFCLFPKKLRKVSIDRARRLSADVLEGADSKECCVVVKSIDDWRSPYEEIFLVGPRAPNSP